MDDLGSCEFSDNAHSVRLESESEKKVSVRSRNAHDAVQFFFTDEKSTGTGEDFSVGLAHLDHFQPTGLSYNQPKSYFISCYNSNLQYLRDGKIMGPTSPGPRIEKGSTVKFSRHGSVIDVVVMQGSLVLKCEKFTNVCEEPLYAAVTGQGRSHTVMLKPFEP